MKSGESSQPMVLVVEDEFFIRIDLVLTLRQAGFVVVEAANADQAIALLEADGDIRLVVTDVNMPGTMDGLMLAAAVRDRWPPVRIIVTSGHVRLEEEDIPVGSRFFTKPYRHAEMVDAVRTMMR